MKSSSHGSWVSLTSRTLTAMFLLAVVAVVGQPILQNSAHSVDAAAGSYYLGPGEGLGGGQYLTSQNGAFSLIMQTDGNLVIYRNSDAAVFWASSFAGASNSPGSGAYMQTDGNFVIYTSSLGVQYHTHTSGSGNTLIMQDDGNAVVYAPGGTAVWSSNPDNMYKTGSYGPNCVGGFYPGTTFCQTDNAAVSWFAESSVTPVQAQTITSVLAGQFNPTDLAVSLQSPAVYAGPAETDIIYQVGTVPPGLGAYTWCDNEVDSNRCDQHYVRFASGYVTAPIVCHESGHAVGLTHGNDAYPPVSRYDENMGCLANPPSTGDLREHNIRQINGTY